ncbi:hypothetical protein ABZZ74_40475 [Streptomyces sp. NPDC006476]
MSAGRVPVRCSHAPADLARLVEEHAEEIASLRADRFYVIA